MNDDFRIVLAISNGMIRQHDVPEDIIPLVFEFLGNIREKITIEDVRDCFTYLKVVNRWETHSTCKKCGTKLQDNGDKLLIRHIRSKSCAKKSKKYGPK